MNEKPRILLQLDPDKHPSSFDAVVAVDSEVEHLLQYNNVTPDDVQSLVYGAIFTRGISDLKQTAIFVGGSNVVAGEELAGAVAKTFFGPMRVSVMMDANGANTTASAAVVAAGRHLDLSEATATVLAATGPVGQRVCRLLAEAGATIKVGSRSLARAENICQVIGQDNDSARLEAVAPESDDELGEILNQSDLLVAAGTTGVQLASKSCWITSQQLRVAIDLNAVPPMGIEGIGVSDDAAEHENVICYGAVGVGGTKMKIHKAAIRKLFEHNDRFLDASEIYRIGLEIESGQ